MFVSKLSGIQKVLFTLTSDEFFKHKFLIKIINKKVKNIMYFNQ